MQKPVNELTSAGVGAGLVRPMGTFKSFNEDDTAQEFYLRYGNSGPAGLDSAFSDFSRARSLSVSETSRLKDNLLRRFNVSLGRVY